MNEKPEIEDFTAVSFLKAYSNPKGIKDWAVPELEKAIACGDIRNESVARLALGIYEAKFGTLLKAQEYFGQAEDLALKAGSVSDSLRARIQLSIARSMTEGGDERELPVLRSILEEFRNRIHALDRSVLHQAIAISAGYIEREEEAIRNAYEALDAVTQVDCPSLHIMILNNLGNLQVKLGNPAEGAMLLERAVMMGEDPGLKPVAAIAAANLSQAYEILGQPERAMTTIKPYLDSMGDVDIHYRSLIPWTAGVSAIGSGDIESARKYADLAGRIEAAGDPGDVMGAVFGQVQIAILRALIAEREDRFIDAFSLAENALPLLGKYPDVVMQTTLREIVARCSAVLGNWERAYREIDYVYGIGKKQRISAAKMEQLTLGVRFQIESAKRERDLSRELAFRDPLTGLRNRRYLEESAPALVSLAERQKDRIAVAMVDIDFFKRVNDTHGHRFGDEVLRRFSAILGSAFRESDIVARYAGEEFCVVMHGSSPQETSARLEDALADFKAVVFMNGDREVTNLSFSAGVAGGGPGKMDYGKLVDRSDIALYRAKELGRSRIEIAD